METINQDRKECNFGTISAEELLISLLRSPTKKKLRDKLMKEKTLEMKKTIKMIKQNTYEKKNKKNTIPDALIMTKKNKYSKNQYREWKNLEPDRKQE